MQNIQSRRGAWNVIGWQILITVCFSVTMTLFAGYKSGLSAILGGCTNALPNMCLVYGVFRHQGARAAKKIANGLYKGEAIKLVVSVFMFILVFSSIDVNPVIFFIAYIASQMVFWVAPLIFKYSLKKSD